MKFKPVYSGPDCSGICVCGHSWEDHHHSCVLNQKYYDDTGEDVVPEECEHYGFNEHGGMEPDGNGGWHEHCRRYIDRGYPRNVDKRGEK